MRDMFTTKPDEGCREVEAGIFARPVQTSEESKMLKLGWSYSIDAQRGTSDVREEKEGRKEEGKVKTDTERAWEVPVDDLQWQAWADKYQAKFGKKPHHKMKWQTIQSKVQSDD